MSDLIADMVRAKRDAPSWAVPPDGCPIVVADDVASWLAAQRPWRNADVPEREHSHVVFRKLLDGPLALAPSPYSQWWLEGTDQTVRPDGDPIVLRTGAMVTVTDVDDDGTSTVRVSSWLAAPVDRPGALVKVGADAAYQVDRTGRAHTDTVRMYVAEPERMTEERFEWAAMMAFDAAIFVIATSAFMLCKNLRPETVDRPVSRPERRRAKAAGFEPVSRYSRLRLPGFQEWRTAQATATGAGPQGPPMHLVRAHPKTYTAERPLLGRAVGTFLWSPQFRGSKDAGSRIPHVTVAPSNEHAIPREDQ